VQVINVIIHRYIAIQRQPETIVWVLRNFAANPAGLHPELTAQELFAIPWEHRKFSVVPQVERYLQIPRLEEYIPQSAAYP
jgi:hypothetical protein